MFRRRGRLHGEASASLRPRLRLAKRRSLVEKGNRADGHHRIEGIKTMKDHSGGHGYVGGLRL
jgi:hypothetical protein